MVKNPKALSDSQRIDNPELEQAIVYKCPQCGQKKKIFIDEFASPQKCPGCGRLIDFVHDSVGPLEDDLLPHS